MKIPLDYGKYYHIYNRGNNYENIFLAKEDYLHFLTIFDAFISPIAETFAWVLLKNHFHVLVRIKEREEVNLKDLPLPVHPKSECLERKLKEPHKPHKKSIIFISFRSKASISKFVCFRFNIVDIHM